MIEIIDNQYFGTSVQENLATVTFKRDIFDLVTNIEESQKLIGFIRSTEYDNDIKGLLILNAPDCFGEEAYDDFMKMIMKERAGEKPEAMMPEFTEKNKRFRQITIINRFVRFLANYSKISAIGTGFTVVTPFIGVYLVADIRFASPATVFSFAHLKYGLHPSGGLPYLLTHYLGHSKAMEIMLSEKLTADQAKTLGLVNRILPAENFDSECKRMMNQYLKINQASLRVTKRLFNYMSKDLDEYFEFEAGLLNL